jgi:hypothetical protein
MNFMISIIGWFLWNWAEFSITKESGDGFVYAKKVNALIDETTITPTEKNSIMVRLMEIFKKPLSLREYAATHYETWVGSLVTIPVILWMCSRQLNLDVFAPIAGSGIPLGWNDLYLLGAGVVWDAFIFLFKYVKNFFRKKENDLKD